MCSHCFVSHIRRGPESIYTGGRLRHRGPLAEERFASGVVDPADCGPRAGSEIDSAELRHLVQTGSLGYYDQGPEEALVQARRQAALAGASGLLAAQRVCLCLQIGGRVGYSIARERGKQSARSG